MPSSMAGPEAKMYLDEKSEWQPIEPQKPKRGISAREERVILWLVVINLAALVIAPIGGASIVQAIAAALGG